MLYSMMTSVGQRVLLYNYVELDAAIWDSQFVTYQIKYLLSSIILSFARSLNGQLQGYLEMTIHSE